MFSRKSFSTRSFSTRSWAFAGIEAAISIGVFVTTALAGRTAVLVQPSPSIMAPANLARVVLQGPSAFWWSALPSKVVLLDNTGAFVRAAAIPGAVTIFKEEYYGVPRYVLPGVFA